MQASKISGQKRSTQQPPTEPEGYLHTGSPCFKLRNIKVGVHPNHALCSVVLKRLIRHGNMHHHFQPSKPLRYYPIISLCTLGKTCSSDGTQVSYKDHSGPTFSIVSLQQNCLCLKTVPMQMDTAQDMQLLGIGEA